MRLFFIGMLSLLLCFSAMSQESKVDSIPLKKVALYGGAAYTAGLFTLSYAWYADNGFDRFKFFNDNAEWKQMDKFGHIFGTYHFSRINHEFLRRTRLGEKKGAYWAAGLSSLLFIPIEILDGFSPDFGFSYGDVIANALGSGLFLGQHVLWKEQRIKVKFSFHQTSISRLRPNTLGRGLAQEILKDYNGQSYWLSFDLHAFFKESKIPKWLNWSIGYGANDMLFARDNQNDLAGYSASRQLFFGPDIDLSYIDSKHKWVRTLLFIADMIRIPMPAIEINRSRLKGHLLYN